MSTKQIETKLTAAEIKYNRRVKSVELAIRAQKNMTAETIVKVSEKIYNYLNQ